MSGSRKKGNEISSGMKCGEFLDETKTNWIFQQDCASWRQLLC